MTEPLQCIRKNRTTVGKHVIKYIEKKGSWTNKTLYDFVEEDLPMGHNRSRFTPGHKQVAM